ncbi:MULTISPECIES: ABC transporter permease [unclassified Hahella]|uniref:ABC transporter permease n=1 Tax=unclassified Hahella TaxID=2624107 RepID=UPI001C1F16EC|nr:MULTISPECIES: ABC transporter permease [unclassified Hahella]MBU6949899.1 ABC transporter permease [Hahella sp. HN01]MDG9668307.1 ABC transporter permease [Hahella sp. CR1]
MLDLKGYGPTILKGSLVTIEVAILSLLLALLLGLLGATAKLSRNPISKAVGTAYTTVIRGVPDLVLMLLIFYGGQIMMNSLSDWLYDQFEIDTYININAFVAGVLTIGFIFGAYMSETFRGAFLAVERGQVEAGLAYGMNRWQIFKRIMFPQMMRHALPGLGNNWLVMLKTTALVSVIGMEDMVRAAHQASAALQAPFMFFIPVLLIFLALTSISEFFFKKLETHYHVDSRRASQ